MCKKDGSNFNMWKVGNSFRFNIVLFCQSVDNILVFFILNCAVCKPWWIAYNVIKFLRKEVWFVKVLNNKFPNTVPSFILNILQAFINLIETFYNQPIKPTAL